jgi:exopolysaccharide biosynthesis glucuronosyltransferase PssE
MIFVTVGTSTQPFDRLLDGVASFAVGNEEVVVQYGASAVRPTGAECVAFLGYDEQLEHMRRARAIVTHAGVGSIIAARLVGKRPFVVPRLRELGEAVDDHQLELAKKLDQAGLVRLVAEPATLLSALSEEAPPVEGHRPENALVDDVRAYLLEMVAARKRSGGRTSKRTGRRR